MKILTVIYMLFLCAPIFAQETQPQSEPTWYGPDSYRGIQWGTSEKTARDDIEIHCTNTLDKHTRTCSSTFQVEDVIATDYFLFVDDKFVGAVIQFDAQSFDSLKATFLANFGSPTSDKVETLQNSIGGSFQNEVLSWTGNTTEVVLQKYDAKVKEGLGHIGMRSYFSRQRTEH